MSRAILSIAAVILFAAQLQAAEIKWGRGTAAGDFIGNYADGTKWDGGVVPGPTDRARVDRGGTEMTLDTTIIANDFLFGVDEEPQTFFFMPGADVTLAGNFIFLNRGQVTMEVQEGASLSVGANFLVGQFDFCCGGQGMLDSDFNVTIAGDVNVGGKTLIGDAYGNDPANLPILTDLLLDVTSGTLTTNAIEFAPNGDIDAFLGAGLDNSMRVRVGDDALISLRGDKVATVTDQIAAGFYFTDSTDGTLGARYDANADLTLVEVRTSVCDFNGDTDCDVTDLNLMLNEGPIAPGVPTTPGVNDQYDLNGDNVIDLADRDLWLADAAVENGLGSPYKIADAGLDGAVDVTDFNSWNSNKFTMTLNWDNGDFNGDGSADVSDFNEWNNNKFTSSDAISAVPEPASAMLLLLASLWGILVKGRRAS